MACGTQSNLVLADRDEWKPKRRILSKTMHQKLLDGYGMNINNIVSNWAENLVPKNGNENNFRTENSTEIIFFNHQYQLSLEILLENIFGCPTNSNERLKTAIGTEKENLLKCVHQALPLVEIRVGNPILSNEILWKIYSWWKGIDIGKIAEKLKNTVVKLAEQRLIDRKEQERSKNQKSVQNPSLIIDILLNLYQENLLTFDELVSEAIVFFLAAIDTTSHGMSGIVYCLSHKNCIAEQEKLVEEIDRFFPEKSDLENESIDSFREVLSKGWGWVVWPIFDPFF